ncbi:unnamed protein product [Danaus chrysippus]|uniref:(African queen) hypothetical protein n=1 Tax=Danaus chrysippus TaxID=151541 RepID=A0A8J2R5E9_9NEOP|nr:unnamed protein product [Danaus chrysippus]
MCNILFLAFERLYPKSVLRGARFYCGAFLDFNPRSAEPLRGVRLHSPREVPYTARRAAVGPRLLQAA